MRGSATTCSHAMFAPPRTGSNCRWKCRTITRCGLSWGGSPRDLHLTFEWSAYTLLACQIENRPRPMFCRGHLISWCCRRFRRWGHCTGTRSRRVWSRSRATHADRKKKATFHVTPAPASPRTALPPAAPHTSDGRAREATSPAAAAHHAGGKRRAASSARRRQGLLAGGGCWTAGAAEGGDC